MKRFLELGEILADTEDTCRYGRYWALKRYWRLGETPGARRYWELGERM